MKYELLQLKSKWLQFKQNVESKNLKIKSSPTEWVPRKIVKDYQHDEKFTPVYKIAKIAVVTPVTNAWPERGASAVKRIKTRSRSSMNCDLLNALLTISINGPALKTKEYEELMEHVALMYADEKHKKCPRGYINAVRKKSLSSGAQTVDIDEISEIEEAEKIDNHLQESLKNKEALITDLFLKSNDDGKTEDSDDSSTESDSADDM